MSCNRYRIQPKTVRQVTMIYLLIFVSTFGRSESLDVNDFSTDWKVHTNGDYQPVNLKRLDEISTIYFDLDPTLFRKTKLSIKSNKSWTLWINGQLVSGGRNCQYDIDSLSRLYSDVFNVAIHSKTGLGNLSTTAVTASKGISTSYEVKFRGSFFFKDFTIIATSLLIIFFLVLRKASPQLTINYFSYVRSFHIVEKNEKLLASNNSSSLNILFYIFCALLYGYLFLIITYSKESYLDSSNQSILSFSDAIVHWGRFSLYVLEALIVKLTIIFAFSSLFNIRQLVSFQFFNFLRFALFISLVMASLCLFIVIVTDMKFIYFTRVITLALLLLTLGMLMVLLKLLRFKDLSFFHLFSYLCVSEVIPLIIIMKILI